MWCVFATGVGREELIQQMCKRHLNNKVYSRWLRKMLHVLVFSWERREYFPCRKALLWMADLPFCQDRLLVKRIQS